MTKWFALCVTALLASAAGCGSGGYTVTGKVTFEEDDSPLTVGVVVFDDGTNSASGMINERGEYSLRFGEDNGGVPNGTYSVRITNAMKEDPSLISQMKRDPKDPDPPETPIVSMIDPKFSSPTTSGLTCEVNGNTTYNIQVTKPGPNYRPFSYD